MTSETFTRGVTDEATGEIYLVRLTIAHPDLAALEIERPDLGISGGVMRFVNDAEDLVLGDGTVFKAFPFEWVRPDEGERARGGARLRIDNVDRRIAETLRLISSAPTVTAEIVLASAPDTVERVYPAFIIPAPSWTVLSVEAELTTREDEDEPACAWVHSPSFSPGIF